MNALEAVLERPELDSPDYWTDHPTDIEQISTENIPVGYLITHESEDIQICLVTRAHRSFVRDKASGATMYKSVSPSLCLAVEGPHPFPKGMTPMKKQTKRPDAMLLDVATLEAHGNTRAEIAESLGITHQALSERINRDTELYDQIKSAYLQGFAHQRGVHAQRRSRKPPFPHKVNPVPTHWDAAMQGLQEAISYCDNFRADNENRIKKTALELDLTQEEYAAQLLNHLAQIPDFADLEDTLNRAIDILSGITYRKFDALRDAK